MENQTALEVLSEKISDILQRINTLKGENEMMRNELITLKSEKEIRDQEIQRLIDENAMKDIEIEEIVSKIESILG
jgi:hypothetical protein